MFPCRFRYFVLSFFFRKVFSISILSTILFQVYCKYGMEKVLLTRSKSDSPVSCFAHFVILILLLRLYTFCSPGMLNIRLVYNTITNSILCILFARYILGIRLLLKNSKNAQKNILNTLYQKVFQIQRILNAFYLKVFKIQSILNTFTKKVF